MRKGGHTSDESQTQSSSSDDVQVIDNSMSMVARYVTLAVLFLVNLLNYMDRYTIAGS